MGSHQASGSTVNNVIEFQSGNSGISFNEDMVLGSSDQAVWVSDDGISNKEASVNMNSKANHEERLSQTEVGSELAHKRARNSPLVDLAASNSSRAFGMLFRKTKLCCKFQVGACSFNEKCNFAHSIEELRQPPPTWQQVVSAHKEEQGSQLEAREVTQILLVGSNDETQGSKTSQQCMKLCGEEGCPYGENCNLIHHEDSKDREHVAICLLPGTGGSYRGSQSKSTLNSANWKTRLCNKWESTGYCPFRSRCHFAHGVAELRRYGGELLIPEAKDSFACGTMGGAVPARASAGAMNAPTSSVPHSYRVGAPPRRLSIMMKRPGETPTRRWKGPGKISKVYGDWVDDLE
ncbi:Zinc finger CCCH domain-containing protein 56 [Sesamum alatum]|uniref:Zinc finger CCCH domain-containing protein 56 n=1 Tax=Sesamum alatum TaxID=300844 RepID=A0AAE1XW50_9LAMI|nr:Zinc finger CCCH domain-containing protein 56 [Sesamum alatum]